VDAEALPNDGCPRRSRETEPTTFETLTEGGLLKSPTLLVFLSNNNRRYGEVPNPRLRTKPSIPTCRPRTSHTNRGRKVVRHWPA